MSRKSSTIIYSLISLLALCCIPVVAQGQLTSKGPRATPKRKVAVTCDERIRESGGLRNNAIYLPQPQYPERARSRKVTGVVRVLLGVNASGKVFAATVICGDPLLRKAAVAAAYQARFKPVEIDGNRTEFGGVISYRFPPQ